MVKFGFSNSEVMFDIAGSQYWVFREADVEPGYPQDLFRYGQGIPTDRIDTAIWWEPAGHTYFFRGNQ